MISALEADTRFVLHYLPKAQPDLPSSQDLLDWPQVQKAMDLVGAVTARILEEGSAVDMLKLIRGNPNQFADIRIKFGEKHQRTWHIRGTDTFKLDAIEKMVKENPWSVVGQAFGHIEPD